MIKMIVDVYKISPVEMMHYSVALQGKELCIVNEL